MNISVIIPVYGVEKFIERTAESLLSQSLREGIEFIFVDDCTKDQSISILERVVERHPDRRCQVKILHHLRNKGLPSARNTGLRQAVGEFVIHVDGDDYVEPQMMAKMLATANENNADIVWSDFYLSYEYGDKYLKQPYYPNPQSALYGILRGAMKYNVWNKLVKRSLYTSNDITFPDNRGMGEDMTMIKLFCHASRVSYLPEAFYHYVKYNSNAFSQTYSERQCEELLKNVHDLESYLKPYLGDDFDELINEFKLEVKFPFLISDDKDKHLIWKNWFEESNCYAWKNKDISFRRRFLQGMASANQWWVVDIYFRLLYKSSIIRMLIR